MSDSNEDDSDMPELEEVQERSSASAQTAGNPRDIPSPHLRTSVAWIRDREKRDAEFAGTGVTLSGPDFVEHLKQLGIKHIEDGRPLPKLEQPENMSGTLLASAIPPLASGIPSKLTSLHFDLQDKRVMSIIVDRLQYNNRSFPAWALQQLADGDLASRCVIGDKVTHDEDEDSEDEMMGLYGDGQEPFEDPSADEDKVKFPPLDYDIPPGPATTRVYRLGDAANQKLRITPQQVTRFVQDFNAKRDDISRAFTNHVINGDQHVRAHLDLIGKFIDGAEIIAKQESGTLFPKSADLPEL